MLMIMTGRENIIPWSESETIFDLSNVNLNLYQYETIDFRIRDPRRFMGLRAGSALAAEVLSTVKGVQG